MVLNSILYAYAFVFTLFSWGMNSTVHTALLVVCCIMFILSQWLQIHPAWAPWVRLLLLCCLHGVAQLNWCMPLYLLVMAKDTLSEENKAKAWSLSFAYATAYLLISFSILENELSTTSHLSIIFQLFNFLAVILISRFFSSTVKQTEMLKREQKILSTRDTLTGLFNYDESHRKLEEFVVQEKPFLLILIDCTDLKSMNTTKGFQAGNLILKQVAELLKILFSENLFISRYGGDEFALAIPLEKNDKEMVRARQQLDSELPKLTGIQITYGIAQFPDDGSTKDSIILVAEHHLFMKKREMWLKREEHLLRSEKLRVVGELASGMAHEIRNPLTTVKGFLQISKANGYNIENWYALIMDEINRMSDLTAEFLQFSKPHATQFRVHSLHECFQRVISLTESEATRLGHEILYECTQEQINVVMDQDKMVQLLLNIVKNAYEAMPENGVISLRLNRQNQYAVLEIADTGKGIPADQLEKIFHPFFTTKDSGTGLGLSICHKIVQDHQGTIEVESFIDQGTKFTITFPLASKDEEQDLIHAAFI
ncbi:sensor histidine kinase [Paenibacillus eucommiae]|uniref:histidine kinase n=1 Tax=Paenibacillus eucommiae TaxID=1355755 RepID=A0ABS4IYV8_9BACL|nr:ATP-binding protein [Paenibacillus eucommiae]MBP1992713.1 diguanylate cyclase (GGDEF)-like protein [Paenibacillus eucommiae]